MKKRLFLPCFIFFICLISAFSFIGCSSDKEGISFKTLTVTDLNVYGEVSNSTEEFSFIDEIKTSGKTKYIVSLDLY